MVTFLTKDEINSRTPSAFATEPHPFMSERYIMVPTEQLIDQLHDAGWGVVEAKQPRTYGGKRSASNKKHMLEFESYDRSILMDDPRTGDKVHPRALLTNSSDGTSRLTMAAGLFAMVCSNGLVVQTVDLGSFSHKHIGLTMEGVQEALGNLTDSLPRITNSMQSMSETILDKDQQLLLADQAREARWGKESTVDSRLLLDAHRTADIGNDLWRVFNRVQENTIRGGFKGEGQKRPARELTNLDALNRVNLALWNSAEAMLAAA
ncbi:MAG: DUF945 domain-containing protein [Flavobacteriales bacterium]|nr:DUF945 domain-containing protein [Flavobacteriales bacterium]